MPLGTETHAAWATVLSELRPTGSRMGAREKATSPQQRMSHWGEDVKVLIAHGDAASRYALREVAEDLTALGLRPVESSEGGQTVDLLTGDDAPELAVIDWDLPGCGGPELCRQVRSRRGARSPYIILIAPGDEQVDEAFAAGADDCLRASAASHELQARIVAARRLGALA